MVETVSYFPVLRSLFVVEESMMCSGCLEHWLAACTFSVGRPQKFCTNYPSWNVLSFYSFFLFADPSAV